MSAEMDQIYEMRKKSKREREIASRAEQGKEAEVREIKTGNGNSRERIGNCSTVYSV